MRPGQRLAKIIARLKGHCQGTARWQVGLAGELDLEGVGLKLLHIDPVTGLNHPATFRHDPGYLNIRIDPVTPKRARGQRDIRIKRTMPGNGERILKESVSTRIATGNQDIYSGQFPGLKPLLTPDYPLKVYSFPRPIQWPLGIQYYPGLCPFIAIPRPEQVEIPEGHFVITIIQGREQLISAMGCLQPTLAAWKTHICQPVGISHHCAHRLIFTGYLPHLCSGHRQACALGKHPRQQFTTRNLPCHSQVSQLDNRLGNAFTSSFCAFHRDKGHAGIAALQNIIP